MKGALMENNHRSPVVTVLIALALIAAMAVSIFYLGDTFSSVDNPMNRANIETLTEKKSNVLALTAGVTGVSAAMTMLPDDTCTPIAEELSDLISSFAVILSAILFEEYMVTITGLIGFRFIIPLGLFLILLYVVRFKNITLKNTGVRLAIFGLAIYLVIPSSCAVIRRIEGTYDLSVQASLDHAQQAINELTGNDESGDGDQESGKNKPNIFSKAADIISSGIDGAMQKVKTTINSCVESLALMIITCCFIPVGMVLVFIWLVKILLGIKVTSPDMRRIADKIPEPTMHRDHHREHDD